MKIKSLLILLLLGLIAGKNYGSSTDSLHYLNIIQVVKGNIFLQTEQMQINVATNANKVKYTFIDYWDKVVEEKEIRLSNKSVAIGWNEKKIGWYKLRVIASYLDGKNLQKETRFAILPSFEQARYSFTPFSIQTHSWQDYQALLPITDKLGVKYIRDCMRWADVEQTIGVYSFPKKYDELVRLSNKFGIKLFATIGTFNPLYDQGNSPTSNEARMAFVSYIRTLKLRYPKIMDMEVWNEPDMPSFTTGLKTEVERVNFYVNLLQSINQGIKTQFLKVNIYGYALSDSPKYFTKSILDSIHQKNGLSYLDAYSFHAYGRLPEAIIPVIEQHKSAMLLHHKKLMPLYLSETGNSTGNLDEHLQANYTARRIITALANGISMVNIYNLQNKDTLTNDRESNFGLIMNPDAKEGAYVPKPAFVAYATLIRSLSGTTFKTEENQSNVFIYKFEGKGNSIRTMYAIKPKQAEVYTNMRISVTDQMGNVKTLSPIEGKIMLPVNQYVIYIKGKIDKITIID